MREYPEIPQESWPVAAPSSEATNGAAPHLTDELLAAWAADELTGDERGAVQRHLESCAYCQSALAETQRIRALARASANRVGRLRRAHRWWSVCWRVCQMPVPLPLLPSHRSGGKAAL